MVVDARLLGERLGELADLLSEALRDEDSVTVTLERVSIPVGSVRTSNRLDYRWQAAILAADDGGVLDKFLKEIERRLAKMPDYHARYRTWLSRSYRERDLVRAVAELRSRSADIEACTDPRDSLALVAALRGALIEIRDAFSDPEATGSLLILDARPSSRAMKDVALACRRALTAVGRLTAGIERAEDLLARERASDGVDTVFARERNVIAGLIDDQYDVGERTRELRSLLRRRVPQLSPPDSDAS